MILKYWKFLHTECDKRLKAAQEDANFWQGKAREAQAMFDYQTKELEKQLEDLTLSSKGVNQHNKMRAAEGRERYYRNVVSKLEKEIKKLKRSQEESAKVSTSVDKKLSNGLKDHKNRPYKFDKEVKDMVNMALNSDTRPKRGRPKGS